MLETQRLLIKPLNHEELTLYVNSEKDFAEKFSLAPSSAGIDEATKEAITNDLLPNLKKLKSDYEFSTMWILIDKETKKIAGGFCFHGLPDENGKVEIGYGTDIAFRNKGYMTEAIKELINWITKSKKVKVIKAETENENISSYKVLEKNGFNLIKKCDVNSLWELRL